MAVVADVDADLADVRLEHRVSQVAGPEVVLLPEALDLRDVGLPVLAQELPVGIDDRGGVVVDAGGGGILLVHRRDDDHARLLGEVLHPLGGRPVGDVLGVPEVLRILHLAEVGAVKQLLEQDHLGVLLRGLMCMGLVLLDHRFLVARPGCLDQCGTDDS